MRIKKLFIAIMSIAVFAVAGFGQEETQTNTVVEPSATVAEKPVGTIRLGVVLPKTSLGEASGVEIAEGIRAKFTEYLKGPTVDVVAIDAKSPSNVNVEATQKGCDFVVYSSFAKKQKTSLFGSLIKIAVPLATSQIPVAASSGEEGTESNQQNSLAKTGVDFVNGTVSKIGAKDVITLDFAVAAVGATSASKASISATARKDGEDVFTLLIEQASEKVLSAVIKK